MKNKIKGLLIAIILCIIYSVSMEVSAEEANVLSVGYVWYYDEDVSVGNQDEQGYGYEYLNTMLDYIEQDYQLEFHGYSIEEGLALLEAGDLDIFGPVMKTNEREADFLYTEADFGQRLGYIATLDETGVYYGDYVSLKNKKIAIIKDDAMLPYLEAFLEENGVEAEIIEVEEIIFRYGLESGEYDYCVTSSIQSITGLKIVAELGLSPIYYITSKENTALIDELNLAQAQLKEEKYLFQENLYLEYFGYVDGESVYITENEYYLMRMQPTYIVMYSKDYAPLSYIDSDGNPAGVSIDVMTQMAEEGNFKVEFIEVGDVTEETKVDMSLLIRYDNSNVIDIIESEPYLELSYLLLEKYRTSQEEEVIGVLDYYAWTSNELAEFTLGKKVVEYDSVKALLDAFQSNEINEMLITTLENNMLSEELSSMDYITTTLTISQKICIEFDEGYNASKINIINKLIGNINSESINYSLMQHFANMQESAAIEQYIEDNITAIYSSVIVVCGILFLVFLQNTIRKKRALLKLVNYDSLTGLRSEKSFLEEVGKKLEANDEEQYSILSVDIDNFKYINETYGYDKGTQVLKAFAVYLDQIIGEEGIVARAHADKFVILVNTLLLEENIDKEMREGDASAYAWQGILGEKYSFSFSVGIYKVKKGELDVPYMIDCAVFAKKKGKRVSDNTITFYTEEMYLSRKNNNIIANAMDEGIANNEFEMYYQPKIDLNTEQLIGAEALVRWNKDDKIISPGEFIPLFEKNGFIIKLDYYVINKVCQFIKNNADIDMPIVSFNLSGVTVMEEDVIDQILAIIGRNQVEAKQLEIEITESALIRNFEVAIRRIDKLRALGFKVSMDDFGTGISTLHRLKELTVDVLKIDRAFIVDTLGNERGILIIKSIIDMAEVLHMETIAEGIETEEQLILLRKLGCKAGQGYYFARPLVASDFLLKLVNN
ncbi:MAG: EAL domain-containing protein [Eubacteriales bacterium]